MAGTALSRQLRQIALATGPTAADVVTKSTGKRGAHIRPSLIFEAKEAADVDAETILHVAQAGLAELVEVDARFRPFLKTLFSPASLQTDRDQEPPEVVAALDKAIDSFLLLLSDTLLLPAAHKPLEYLIRKYRVQQCNVDSLVVAALPYHETNLFVRIVQLVNLKHSKWAPVLHGCKVNGAAIPRSQLVQRCVKDDSFFHAMCHAAEKAASLVTPESPPSSSSPSAPAPAAMRLLTFTSVLLLEALSVMRVSLDALTRLLPFVLNGLQPSALHEHRLAAMMLVSQLANRSQLSTQVINSLLIGLLAPTAAASSASATQGGRQPPSSISMDAFLVVVHLSATQRVLSLPPKAANSILADRHFIEVLKEAADRFNTGKILKLVVDTMLTKISSSQPAADLLLAIVRQLPRAALSPLIPRLSLSLLRFTVGKDLPQCTPSLVASLRHRIQPILLALSLKFTSQTDAAVAAVLESLASSPAQRATLVSFLGTALSASPCALQRVDASPAGAGSSAGATVQQQQLLSVHLAVDHPQWQVRKAAVEQLPGLLDAAGKHAVKDEAAENEVQSFVSAALQRRLADDNWQVLHAAVTSPLLSRVLSPSLLCNPLKAILLRPLPPAADELPAHVKVCQSTALHLLRTVVVEPGLKAQGEAQGNEGKGEKTVGELAGLVEGVAKEVMPHVLLSAVTPAKPHSPTSPLANPQLLQEALLLAQQLAPRFPLFRHLPSPSLAALSSPSFSASDALSLIASSLAVALTPPSPVSSKSPDSDAAWRIAIHFSRSALAASTPAGRQLLLLALLWASHDLPATSTSLEALLRPRGSAALARGKGSGELVEGRVRVFVGEAVGLLQDAWKGVVLHAGKAGGREGENRTKGTSFDQLDALLSSVPQATFSAPPDLRAKLSSLLSSLSSSSASLCLSADLALSCLSSILRKFPDSSQPRSCVWAPHQQSADVAGQLFDMLVAAGGPRAASLAAARIAAAVQREDGKQGGKREGEGAQEGCWQGAMVQALQAAGSVAGEASGEDGSKGQQGIATLLQLLLARFATRASFLSFLDPFLLPSLPPSPRSTSIQLAALALVPTVAAATSAVPGDAPANEELPTVVVGVLMRLLVTVQSPLKPVRKASVHGFASLAQAIAGLPHSVAALPSPSSVSLIASAFASAEDALLSDISITPSLSSSPSGARLLFNFTSAGSSFASNSSQAAALLARLLDPTASTAATGTSMTPTDRAAVLTALFTAATSLPPWPQALAVHMLASVPAASPLLPLQPLLGRLHSLLSRRLHCHLHQSLAATGVSPSAEPVSVEQAALPGGRLGLDEVQLLVVGLQLVTGVASRVIVGRVQLDGDMDEDMREEGEEKEEGEESDEGEESERQRLLLKGLQAEGQGVTVADVAPLLLMAMQVQGATSADDVAVEAPSITAAGLVTTELLHALSCNHQDGLVASLLFLMAASEASSATRQAAKDALRRLKLKPSTLARLISSLFSPPPLSHGAPEATNNLTTGVYVLPSDWLTAERRVAVATGLMEMLLWKDDLRAQQILQLFPSLAVATTAILSHRWPLLRTARPDDGGEQPVKGEGSVTESEVAMSTQLLGAVEFVLQLLLTVARNALSHQLAQEEEMENHGEDGEEDEEEEGIVHGEEECVEFMVGAAVEVVKGRRDPATASAAIAVLAAAAERQPEEVVEHVVAVLSVAATTSLALDIRESHDAIHRLMEAVLPAWLHHNPDVTHLLQLVVASLPSMLHHHRVALLAALLRGVSPSLGLAPLLLLLLTTTGVTPALLSAHANNNKDASRTARSRRLAALQQHAYWRRSGDSVGNEEQGGWGLSLAFELCAQVPGSIRLEAYVKLLEATCPPINARKKGKAAASEAFDWWKGTGPDDDVVVVRFVAAEMPAAMAAMEEEEEVDVGVVEGEARAAVGEEGGHIDGGDATMVDGGSALNIPHGQLFVSLLEHVVLRLRATAAAAAAAVGSAVSTSLTTLTHPPAPKDRTELVASAAYELLQTLDDVTPSGVFLQAVQTLLTNPSSHIRRKVLRLLASRVRSSMPHASLAAHGRGKAVNKKRMAQAAREEAGEYAAVAGQLAHMGTLEGADRSLSTQMAALQTLDAIIKRFASLAPDDFHLTLTPLIRIISSHSSPPLLTAAALRCLSSLASSLNHLLLPHLPLLMPPLFTTAESALAAAGKGMVQEGKVEDEEDGGKLEEQMEDDGAHGREEVVSADVAHDLLAAVLQALEAMLAAMGPLLSPFTPRILACTCLSPALLCCTSPSVLQHAHAVRLLLIEKLPMRLLLDPLVSSWSSAAAAGPAPSAALLHMLARAASHMDRSAASTFHARIFDFLLLRTFDVRRSPPFPTSTDGTSNQMLPGGTQVLTGSDVEGAAVEAMVAVVMKTSESVFKPMFVRVLEWAASEYAADGDSISPAGQVNRHLTLFGLVNVLSDKLRSVFVPYFQYLFDIAIRHLVGLSDAAAKAGMKKKRRKSAGVAAAAEDSIAQWQLRHLVVCALHKCFVYDSNAAFLDGTKFQALLEPIISQIDRDPPAGVASIVSAPSAPEVPSAAMRETQMLLPPYIAASVPSISDVDDELVACLGEMTIAGGSDILWKQLNHQVLMCTRSERARSRQLALRVINEVVDRVREEYVVLLPETIPFLAELLEDSDPAVAESAKSLVKKLEELSGEELTQYF